MTTYTVSPIDPEQRRIKISELKSQHKKDFNVIANQVSQEHPEPPTLTQLRLFQRLSRIDQE